MAFKKGQSGNPAGRPKGVANKVTVALREKVNSFLEKKFKKVVEDFDNLPPKDRVKLYSDLLQYGLPKLQSTPLESEFDCLSDDQLQIIIDKLKAEAIKHY